MGKPKNNINSKILPDMGILSNIFGKITRKRNKSSDGGTKSSAGFFSAKRITITQLEGELELLRKGKTEFDFFGIHSNGVDCIYFTKVDDKFNIEFEAMHEDQIPFIEKLKEYARSKGFQHSVTTYGNRPHYDSVKDAPVVRLETKTNLKETAKIGSDMENVIFGNNDETEYEVVP